VPLSSAALAIIRRTIEKAISRHWPLYLQL
jgi:hypothetical protein